MIGHGTRPPLPRGSHGLSREEVERSQRERLLGAMAEVVGEKGYVHTAVADVLARAGVSRATFYAMFRDKEDCFRATYAEAAGLLARVMAAALEAARASCDAAGSPAPLQLLDQVLTVYLRALQASPALARTFLVEVYAAGPQAVRQRRESLEAFIEIVTAIYRGTPGPIGPAPDQRFAAELLVHAVSSMVTHRVGVGDTAGLLDLRAPLLALAESLVSCSTSPEGRGRLSR
jgi:AcrR family transcriptional regulator